MQIDREPQSSTTTVIFEVDPHIDFQERVIAINALGVFVARHANEPELRTPAGFLGIELSQLPGTEEVEGEKKAITATTEMKQEDLELLEQALSIFINDTPEAIKTFLQANNAGACNARAVEAAMASKMLADISVALDKKSAELSTSLPVGFSK